MASDMELGKEKKSKNASGKIKNNFSLDSAARSYLKISKH